MNIVCLFRGHWWREVVYSEGSFVDPFGKERLKVEQFRECRRCGKVVDRRVTFDAWGDEL